MDVALTKRRPLFSVGYDPRVARSHSVFSRIRNPQDALQIVRDASVVYFTLAIFQLVVAITGKFDTFSAVILADVVVNVILGAILRTLNSRVAAVGLLLNLIVACVVGDGPLFHILLLPPSLRAVEAAWKINSESWKHPEIVAVPSSPDTQPGS